MRQRWEDGGFASQSQVHYFESRIRERSTVEAQTGCSHGPAACSSPSRTKKKREGASARCRLAAKPVAPVFNRAFGCPLRLARIASLPTRILLHRPKAGHGICLYARSLYQAVIRAPEQTRDTRGVLEKRQDRLMTKKNWHAGGISKVRCDSNKAMWYTGSRRQLPGGNETHVVPSSTPTSPVPSTRCSTGYPAELVNRLPLNLCSARKATVAFLMFQPVHKHGDRAEEPEQRIGEVYPDGILHPLDARITFGILLDVHLKSAEKKNPRVSPTSYTPATARQSVRKGGERDVHCQTTRRGLSTG